MVLTPELKGSYNGIITDRHLVTRAQPKFNVLVPSFDIEFKRVPVARTKISKILFHAVELWRKPDRVLVPRALTEPGREIKVILSPNGRLSIPLEVFLSEEQIQKLRDLPKPIGSHRFPDRLPERSILHVGVMGKWIG